MMMGLIRGLVATLLTGLWVLVIVLLSEQATFFDKTQWFLVVIINLLISISLDVHMKNKE